MDNWWECRRCKLPNDPRYESCVSCGCTGSSPAPNNTLSSSLLLLSSPHLLQGSSPSSQRRRGSPPQQIGSSTANRMSPPRSSPFVSTPPQLSSFVMKTPDEWSHGQGSILRYRDDTMQTPPPSSAMLSSYPRQSLNLSPRLQNAREVLLSTIGGLFQGDSHSSYRSNGAVETHVGVVAHHGQQLQRSPDRSTTASHRTASPPRDTFADRVEVAEALPAFPEDMSMALTNLQGHYAGGPLKATSATSLDASSTVAHDEQHDGDDAAQSSHAQQHFRLASSSSLFRQHEQKVQTGAAAALQEQQQLVFQLKAQLSDTLLELHSSREQHTRLSTQKDRDIATLQREVHRWKDEVLSVQKQNQDLARELRREHERKAELIVQTERLRVQANQRVPDIVAEEFRLRLDTALESRAAALQGLGASLQMLSMSIGDGIGHKVLAHSLDAASLLHSKTVVALQARVRELEEELLQSR